MKYYWIDSSCGGLFKLKFQNFIVEAQTLAGRAVERLESPTDTDFARIFNIIFKTPKTSTAEFPLPDLWFELNGQKDMDRELRPKKSIPDQVIETLKDFASDWEQTRDREKANVRIYNNTAKRITGDSFDGIWEDPINHLKTCGDLEAARKEDNGITIGECKGYKGPNGKENPKRCTIDILPSAWKASSSNLPLSVEGLKTWIAKTAIPCYPVTLEMAKFAEAMMTLTVAHEFMHTHAYGFTDGTSTGLGGQETAGWAYIMKETKDMAYENAEAVALLIIAAGFADLRPHKETTGGFTLDRSWDSIPGAKDPIVTNSKWDFRLPKNHAAKGIFRFYKDLTK